MSKPAPTKVQREVNQARRFFAGSAVLLLALSLSACGGGSGTSFKSPAPTVSIKAAAGQVAPGQSVVLNWSSLNATSVTLNPAVSSAPLPLAGSATVTPGATTTYTMTANGPGGGASSAVTVNLSAPSPPAVSVAATPPAISTGGTTTLTWTSSNADSITINPSVGSEPLPLTGSVSVNPAATINYTVTANGAGGNASSAVTVNVTPPNPPAVTVVASPSTVSTGGTATLTWTSSNADNITITPSVGSGTLPLSGSISVTPAATTTYTINAGGAEGTATATAAVAVIPPATASNPTDIPPDAQSSEDLTQASQWEWNHDGATPGSSVGSSTYPVGSPSLNGAGREYKVSYSGHGGEIYHLAFANDTTATHFVYDTYVYLTDPSQVGVIELDVNQVMSSGKTVIFGTQCSSNSGTWEFTTVSHQGPHWNPSNIPCNPKTWTANAWHHIQIASHRDDNGVVTYDWINLDGTTQSFHGAQGDSALSLHWQEGTILINFQLDGADKGSGSIKAYMDSLVIYRW